MANVRWEEMVFQTIPLPVLVVRGWQILHHEMAVSSEEDIFHLKLPPYDSGEATKTVRKMCSLATPS